jgi:phenylacetate-CoA ligase
MLQKIRRNTFWTLDRLKGSEVKKHLEQITDLMEVKSASEKRDLNDQYLRDLLDHSVTTVPFYHSYSRASSLTEFPVIDKDVIRSNYSNFRSGQYSDDEVIPAITSGSTGTPF